MADKGPSWSNGPDAYNGPSGNSGTGGQVRHGEFCCCSWCLQGVR